MKWFVHVIMGDRVIDACGPLDMDDAEAAEAAYTGLRLGIETRVVTETEHAQIWTGIATAK
jgi:hypothetical protein